MKGVGGSEQAVPFRQRGVLLSKQKLGFRGTLHKMTVIISDESYVFTFLYVLVLM